MTTATKSIQVSPENMRYSLKGAIFFRDTEGNQYEADRKGALELASLILEALDMDISERDELLFRLEDQNA